MNDTQDKIEMLAMNYMREKMLSAGYREINSICKEILNDEKPMTPAKALNRLMSKLEEVEVGW